MKKYLFTILSLVIIPSVALAAFSDVSSRHPNYDAINYVQQRGIVGGYSDGSFRPDNLINRAEFTKIITLYRFGQEMVDMCGTKYLFNDTDPNAWYIKYICRAKDAHIIEGYPDGTFRPENKVNFAEAAKIIATASCQNTSDPRLPEEIPGKPWYDRYIRFLDGYNAIPSSIVTYDQYITRGDMAEVIYRLNKTTVTSPAVTVNN